MPASSHMAPSVADIAREESASPEQVMASALAFYSAIPRPIRSTALSLLQSSDAAAHTALVNEMVRTLVSFELNQRRQTIRQLVTSGKLPSLPALSDADAGAEAVRLVEESRARRAAAQR